MTIKIDGTTSTITVSKQTGPTGPAGPQGSTGPQGPQGDKGDTRFNKVSNRTNW